MDFAIINSEACDCMKCDIVTKRTIYDNYAGCSLFLRPHREKFRISESRKNSILQQTNIVASVSRV